ncbi:MAG: PTS sugar transporter subunit IIA, partial [Actinobacteria bacterium]|nr:PTS sugar transporter subunit IIA [Actinomycetota bacterium]
MGLLADAFGEGSILLKGSVENRSAAIELAGELLVASGRATAEYVASMLEAVEKFGPYIVIAPGIALAHGKPSDDVIETGLSLLVLENAIEFQHSQNDPVQLVFGLAATDHESH